MCARGYAEADVEKVLDNLVERGLVSDRRMVETYVAERVRKGFGPVRIRQELRYRGLSDALIKPGLGRSTWEWREAMSAAHDKRFGPTPAADSKKYARRARFLEYRGFPAELIASFLDGKDEF